MSKEFRLTNREEGFLEGFAKACEQICYALTGDFGSAKSYDPLTVDGTIMHSYAFNLKDGSRHHSVKEYDSVEEIWRLMLEETLEQVNQNPSNARLRAALDQIAKSTGDCADKARYMRAIAWHALVEGKQ
jgi:hypothetical protein